MTYEQIVDALKQLLSGPALMNFAAIVLSLVASYVPGWREKWAAKDPTFKSLGMLLSITGLAIVIGVVSFTKFILIVPADSTGVVVLIVSWGTALWTNATTYTYSPQLPTVLAIKAAAKSK